LSLAELVLALPPALSPIELDLLFRVGLELYVSDVIGRRYKKVRKIDLRIRHRFENLKKDRDLRI
jgi:hypothetical protein